MDLHNYSRFEENGLERCPICGLTFGGQAGHLDDVYGPEGTHYDHFYDSPPDEGPFYCPECFEENREEILSEGRAADRGLDEFVVE